MSSAGAQSRKPARLSQPLNRGLSTYALAAGAFGVSVLALAPPADAEIVYTQIHQAIGRSQNYAIDLNHDGITDFTIENLALVGGTSGYSARRVEVLPAAGNAVDVNPQTYRDYLAAALSPGAQIGPSQPVKFRPEIMAQVFKVYGETYYYFGSWLNVSNRYLGLRFKIDDEWHYGWARLTVQSNLRLRIVAVLTGYAYETEANTSITAGDAGSANGEEANSGSLREMFSAPTQEAGPLPTLGTLALGASGLTIWRRSETKFEPK
jgi:hypothetical protein